MLCIPKATHISLSTANRNSANRAYRRPSKRWFIAFILPLLWYTSCQDYTDRSTGTRPSDSNKVDITLSKSNVTFMSGEGSIVGARNLEVMVEELPQGENPTIQWVIRNNMEVAEHSFYIDSSADQWRVTLGNSDDKSAAFPAPAAGQYRLVIGCAGCNDADLTVEVIRGIAIFTIGSEDGDFGFNRCSDYLNATPATNLAVALVNDGFSPARARFFGGKTTNWQFYDFNTLDTDPAGLNLSDDAAGSGRPLYSYRVNSEKVLRTATGLSIRQMVEVESGSAIWQNGGAAVISSLIGDTGIFWSLNVDGFRATSSCSSASTNSASTNGIVGNVNSADGHDGAGAWPFSCANEYHVLCVVK